MAQAARALVKTILAATVLAFALFSAEWTAPSTDSVERREIIEPATKALDRDSGAVRDLHTEGLLQVKGIRDVSVVAKRDHLWSVLQVNSGNGG
jgi:hypothetical protein